MHKRVVLDNGLTIVLENTNTVRSVCIGVWVKAGAMYEDRSINGVSHFLEHMLFKGTKTRSARQIAEAMDSVGGQLNAFSAKEFTCFFTKVRDEHAEMAVELLADMLKNSVFDPDEIAREKNVVIEEIKMYDDAPDELIHDIFSQSLWRNHPLGYPILGTTESVNSLDRKKLVRYFSENYVPSNFLVTAVGNFRIPRLVSWIKKYFDQGGSRKASADHEPVTEPRHAIRHEIREKKVEQVHMVLGTYGIPECDEDRYKLYILNSIFGGSMSSRLFQEIREKRGLAYSIFSYATLYKIAGLFAIYAGCGHKDCDTVIELILGEIHKIKNEPIGREEIARAKEQLKGNMILSLEGVNARMNRLGRNEIYFKRHVPIDEVLEKISRVTADDVHEMARKLFDVRKLGVSLIGPAGESDKKMARCVCLLENISKKS